MKRDLSGDISEYAGLTTGRNQDDTDSAGMPPAKHTIFSLRLTLPDGTCSILYGHLAGGVWMDAGKTVIEVLFSGFHRHEGDWRDGLWLAVITGKRVEGLFFQIAEGRRISVFETGVVEDQKKPEVRSITITAYEVPEEEG